MKKKKKERKERKEKRAEREQERPTGRKEARGQDRKDGQQLQETGLDRLRYAKCI